MSRPFKVPPVVFPTPRPVVPRPGFRPSAAPLPFLPFDVPASSAASSSGGGGGFFTPAPTAVNSLPVSTASGDFSHEPPLLEELGIDTRQIVRKITSLLTPFSPNPAAHTDADLAGPFLLLTVFGLFQLLSGKLHFGIILGWGIVGSIFLYSVLNMMAGRRGDLDLHRCVSLLGYCMLPMVMASLLGLFMVKGGVAVFVVGMVGVVWSTRACVRLLGELEGVGEHSSWLVAYPCALVYLLFSLLVIF